MAYGLSGAGRVSLDGSGDGSVGDPRLDRSLWTPELVEERLIAAVELWRRSPGGGTSPFAGDGPWELITREARAGSGMEAWRQEQDQERDRAVQHAGSLPLTREEVAERDAASAMVLLVPERDRRLVMVTVAVKATGRRVRWSAIRAKLGPVPSRAAPVRWAGVYQAKDPTADISLSGLGARYTRALAAMAKGLNRLGSLSSADVSGAQQRG